MGNWFSNIGHKGRATLIGLLAIAVVFGLIGYGYVAIQRLNHIDVLWGEYNKKATATTYAVNRINRHIGYGGLIHNFKNYILRGDPALLVLIEANRKGVKDAINYYRSLDITLEERAALDVLQEFLQRYVRYTVTAKKAFELGRTPEQVDHIVQINDAEALEAIARLSSIAVDRSYAKEQETTSYLQESVVFFLYGALIIPVIIGLAFLVIFFLRRVVDANRDLSGARQQITQLLEHAPDASITCDEKGNILFANQQAESLFGYPSHELLEMKVEDLVPHSVRDMHKHIRDKYFEGPISRPMGQVGEYLAARTRKGDLIPVEISLNSIEQDGRVLAIATIRDVTQRKFTEDELRQTQESLEVRVRERTASLWRANQSLETEISERKRAEDQLVQSAKMATLGEMASGIAHELNQPLNIIRMGAEGAKLRLQRAKGKPVDVGKTLDDIEGQVDRMAQIIDHMRVFARDDRVEIIVFNPVECIRDASSFFDNQFRTANIDLKIEALDDCRAVRGHPIRLEQVCFNLLSNAYDAIISGRGYSPEDSARQETVEINIADNLDDDRITITVTDSGEGIPHDVLPEIFTPFFTTKEVGTGTGLGLSICYGIVESMGGEMRVDNTGNGARFSIDLPAVGGSGSDVLADSNDDTRSVDEEGSLNANVQGVADAPLGGGVETHVPKMRYRERLSVLVVDDEELAAKGLARYLEDEGHSVDIAFNGNEALEKYQASPVDLVITDLRMPEMDGPMLVVRLKAIAPDVPIILLSGHLPFGEDQDIHVEGVDYILKKPVRLSEISRVMDEVVQ